MILIRSLLFKALVLAFLFLELFTLSYAIPLRTRNYIEVYDPAKGWVSLGISPELVRRTLIRQYILIIQTQLNAIIYDQRNHLSLEIPNPIDIYANEFLVVIPRLGDVIIYDSLTGRKESFRLTSEVLLLLKVNDPDLLLYETREKRFSVPLALLMTSKRGCVYHGGVGLKCHSWRLMNRTPLYSLSSTSAVSVDEYGKPIVYDSWRGEFRSGYTELSISKVKACLKGAGLISTSGVQVYDLITGKWHRRLGSFNDLKCDLNTLWVIGPLGDVELYIFGKGWVN